MPGISGQEAIQPLHTLYPQVNLLLVAQVNWLIAAFWLSSEALFTYTTWHRKEIPKARH
jgi:predicted Rdx family selenoprotein